MASGKKTLKGCGGVFGGFVFLSVLASFFSSEDHSQDASPPPKVERESRAKVDTEKQENSEPVPMPKLKPPKTLPIIVEEPVATESREIDLFEAEAPAFEPKPASIAALIPTPSRKWTNPEGRTVLGVVSSFDPVAETATLRTAAGETLENFPLSKFSEADSQYLSNAAKGILSGRVVGVHDGDSITLLVAGNTQFKIRLEAIDAPELGQEYGNNAKTGLGEMVYGKDVAVHVTGADKYQRLLGFVWLTDTLVNQAMIERGLAWHFKEYSDDEKLAQSELDARDQNKGLWRDYNPMSPWDWRELQRTNAAAKKAAELTIAQPFVSTPSTGLVTKEKPVASFWLNISGGKRHNASCRWYGNTKRGRYCSKSEGSACGICGG